MIIQINKNVFFCFFSEWNFYEVKPPKFMQNVKMQKLQIFTAQNLPIIALK